MSTRLAGEKANGLCKPEINDHWGLRAQCATQEALLPSHLAERAALLTTNMCSWHCDRGSGSAAAASGTEAVLCCMAARVEAERSETPSSAIDGGWTSVHIGLTDSVSMVCAMFWIQASSSDVLKFWTKAALCHQKSRRCNTSRGVLMGVDGVCAPLMTWMVCN